MEMRKKELLNQNIALFEELEKCRITLKDYTDQLLELNNKVSKLELENKILKSRISNLSDTAEEEKGFTVDTNAKEPTDNTKTSAEDFVLNREMQYGSEIIGKIVIETAMSINKLNDCDEEIKRELSNLIVCKSEVAKSEILSVCNSEAPINTKIEMIDSVLNDTIDYYKSVLGQI